MCAITTPSPLKVRGQACGCSFAMNKQTKLFVGCLKSQQQASVSQGRICSDNFTCCHSEVEAADPTFYLTQSQYTDTRPSSPSADPITPGAWQGSHWSAIVQVSGMTRPGKSPSPADSNTGSSALEADTLTTRPTRMSSKQRLYKVLTRTSLYLTTKR